MILTLSPSIRAASVLVVCLGLAWVGAPISAFAQEPAPAAATATATATSDADDDDLPFRLSLPTESDRVAWRHAGFRLDLGLRHGWTNGLAGAPSGSGYGVVIRIGGRLDESWSVFSSFMYGAASGGAKDLAALRYLAAIEPVFHIGDHLELGVGLGLGGMVEGGSRRADPDAALRDALVAPYTLPTASPPLPACNSAGVASTLRLAYAYVLGPTSRVGVEAQIDGQYAVCVDNTGEVEPDTATAIVRRQWWPHYGASLALTVGWR